ncbi:MAG: hypothetical protein IJ364_05520 [Oscillospiraceae bacterium]|nr:hypothetical protein [Oscillospiraceae bacterium]
MILIRNIKLQPKEGESELLAKAAKKLRVKPELIKDFKFVKKSLDARRKEDIHYVCTIAAQVAASEDKLIRQAKSADVAKYEPKGYEIPSVSSESRPLVVGFGPAGIFAALVLAMAGAKPLVIERGQDALTRKAAVDHFLATGKLDPDCNIQFGEGGAGTFSDGKLNTGVKDRRMDWMFSQFVEHGAPKNIAYDAKPHIGTDILINIVQNIRKKIISLGGQVLFGTKLERLVIENGAIVGALVSDRNGLRCIDCTQVILALGHSARDSFEMLLEEKIPMEPKAFSMGVRIEHLQKDINAAQYGEASQDLPAADYSLNVHLPDGTSAYSFCMCPGGHVIAAASEREAVVTNGMSYSRRDSRNANAALLVTLNVEDFPDRGVLSGMYWQREIEQRAFIKGGCNYHAPAQLVGDFLKGKASTGHASVIPSYEPGVTWCDLHQVLPQRITSVLEKAIPELGKKLPGFDNEDAVMTAPETRSSSPVRILRDEMLHSEVKGLYPCGEGAGYAGGISSAALDGMRCAEAVLRDIE